MTLIKSYNIFIVKPEETNFVSAQTGKFTITEPLILQDVPFTLMEVISCASYTKEFGFCNIIGNNFHHLGHVSRRWDSRDFMRCYA